MISNKLNCSLFFLLFSGVLFAQEVTLLGSISGRGNIEGIHVNNKSKNLFAVTNPLGVFKITVAVSDTLVFSAIQYKSKSLTVTSNHVKNKTIAVVLDQQVNTLSEVVVGNTLTGNLQDDINSLSLKPQINFYNLGIPGYTGKQKTKSERRLQEAGEFKPKMLLGLLLGSVPINPILNGLSGRTKMLKKRIALETNTVLMNTLKSKLSETFFSNHPLEKEKRMDFFYFCAEAKNFAKRCANSDIKALQFMSEKYIEYKKHSELKE